MFKIILMNCTQCASLIIICIIDSVAIIHFSVVKLYHTWKMIPDHFVTYTSHIDYSLLGPQCLLFFFTKRSTSVNIHFCSSDLQHSCSLFGSLGVMWLYDFMLVRTKNCWYYLCCGVKEFKLNMVAVPVKWKAITLQGKLYTV
jgi:hypothetical protein